MSFNLFGTGSLTKSGGRYCIYQNDPNGTPLRVYDDQGEVVWEARYPPQGTLSYTRVSLIRQPLRMQEQYYDTESGLHYNR